MASLTPLPKMQFFDTNGNFLVGGKIYTYEQGTTTPLTTYTTQAGDVANTNPVILDSKGQASVWLGSDPYTIVVHDSDDVLQSDGGDVFPALYGFLDVDGLIDSAFLPESLISYDTVADMIADTLEVDTLYITKGYTTEGDRGNGIYLIQTSAAFGSTPDNQINFYVNSGTLVAKLLYSGPLDARKAGAIEDTDSYEALQAAFDFSPAVLISGIFESSKQLTVSGKSFSLIGSGIGTSRILWTTGAATSGIDITLTDTEQQINVEDISLKTQLLGVGTAIFVDGSSISYGIFNGDRVKPQFTANDLWVIGDGDAQDDGWDNGLHFEGLMNVAVDDYDFTGYINGGVNHSDSGIKITGSNIPIHNVYSKLTIISCQYGVFANNDGEGLIISDSFLVDVDYGVHWVSTKGTYAGSPQLNVNNTHINARFDNVYAFDVSQIDINNCLFYKRPNSTADSSGIHIEDSVGGSIINNNVFVNASATFAFDGVFLDGDTINTRVIDNTFQTIDTGLVFGAGTANNDRHNNQYYNVAVAPVSDLGDNIKPTGLYSHIKKDAVQAIVTATPTEVIFDSVIVDTLGGVDLGVDANVITIPSRVFNISVEAGITWQNNSTGTRTMQIYKNGSASTVAPTITQGGATTSSMSLFSANIPVTAGDEISVYVTQTSGGNLTLAGTFQTYLKVAVMPRVF